MGFRIWFVPTIGSIQLGGESTSKKSPPLYILSRQVEGFRYFHKKHYPKFYLLINFSLRVGCLIRSLLYFILGKKELSGAYLRVAIY
jgi:hypothetical protein